MTKLEELELRHDGPIPRDTLDALRPYDEKTALRRLAVRWTADLDRAVERLNAALRADDELSAKMAMIDEGALRAKIRLIEEELVTTKPSWRTPMTDSINDGGPAFPDGLPGGSSGASLRDAFAWQALAGFSRDRNFKCLTDGEADELAARVYRIADAMLRARELG